MAIPIPCLVINITIYIILLTYTVIFGISKSVESAKLGPLTKFRAQLFSLAAWQVPKTHQGTFHRSHHSIIFQL